MPGPIKVKGRVVLRSGIDATRVVVAVDDHSDASLDVSLYRRPTKCQVR